MRRKQCLHKQALSCKGLTYNTKMMKKRCTYPYIQRLSLLAFALCFGALVVAQPSLPQRSVTVLPTQELDFGIFYASSAGTITVDWQGTVSTTGGVVSLSSSTVKPAIFDVSLCQGRNVTVTYAPSVTLYNGVPSLTLNVGPTEKGPSGSTFPVNGDCSFITMLRVGGTLVIPGGAVSGVYNGSFSLTFTQE